MRDNSVSELRFKDIDFKRLRRLGRESFWIGLGQVTAAIGALFGVRILTHALPPAVYGELALGMTLATLTMNIISTPLSNACLRFFAPAREVHQLRAYFSAIRNLIIKSTTGLIGLVFLFCVLLYFTELRRWLPLILTSFTFAILYSYCSVLDGIQNAARRRLVVALHNGASTWIRFIAAFSLVSFLTISSHIAMSGYAFGAVLILISQIWFFRKNIYSVKLPGSLPNETDIRIWSKKMITYAWPFVSFGIFNWGQIASDRWALDIFSDTDTVGLYAALFQIGYYPMIILFLIISQVATPILFSRSGDGKDPGKVNQVYRLNHLVTFGYIVLTIGLFLLSYLFAEQIFSVVVDSRYREVAGYLPWMILAGGLFAIGQNTAQIFMINTDTRSLVAPKVITSILGIIIIFVGAFIWGLSGVIIARILFSILHLIWIFFLVHSTGIRLRNKYINEYT